jgi:hypothetical protein
MPLGLDTVLQLLSLAGCSVFSLIDDILARGEWEDEGIKRLQEGITRDAVDICARLLSHKPASASISAWALVIVQAMPRSEEEMPRKVHYIQNNTAASPGLTDGASLSCPSIGDPERVFGRVQCTCSRFSVGPAMSIDARVAREKSSITDIERQSTFSRIMSSLKYSISAYKTRTAPRIPLNAQGNGKL